ncbi:hypothetical protein GCM10007881_16700 [Mesorhizobium huakuii]|nr:hypothetical protein GCM10007881_16700 [Mesorhizobium huakuii]
MLSAKTLADPRIRQARADLATFASDERMVQLCNLEAMDQIRRWRADFQPERVVPYATAEEKISGTTIAADGCGFPQSQKLVWSEVQMPAHTRRRKRRRL